MKNKNLALVLATALVLGACGNQATSPKDKAQEEKPAVEEKAEDGVKEVASDDKKSNDDKNVREFKRSPVPKVEKSMEDAIKIFHDHFKDETINIKSIKLDFFNEALDYVIEGFKEGNEYELRIAADNGAIVDEKTEKDDDKDEKALDISKIIKAEDAMKKALEGQKEDAWVVEYELEIDDGKAVYDIDVENGQDVKIDATSGEIIERD